MFFTLNIIFGQTFHHSFCICILKLNQIISAAFGLKLQVFQLIIYQIRLTSQSIMGVRTQDGVLFVIILKIQKG